MTAYTHRHLRKFQRETLAKLQSPAQTTQRRGAFSSCWRLACCSFLGATLSSRRTQSTTSTPSPRV
eukprot:scaffold18276_cov84-Phaeocystis_antarctica.AAC.1